MMKRKGLVPRLSRNNLVCWLGLVLSLCLTMQTIQRAAEVFSRSRISYIRCWDLCKLKMQCHLLKYHWNFKMAMAVHETKRKTRGLWSQPQPEQCHFTYWSKLNISHLLEWGTLNCSKNRSEFYLHHLLPIGCWRSYENFHFLTEM